MRIAFIVFNRKWANKVVALAANVNGHVKSFL